MKFRPLYDRIVVKPDSAPTHTPGGLLLPETITDRPQVGEVIAAGAGVISDAGVLRALDVKVGDRVLFSKYAGSIDVKIEGESYIILKESDVIGIL